MKRPPTLASLAAPGGSRGAAFPPDVRVQVAYVGPGIEALVTLEVAADASVDDAVLQSGMLSRIDVPRAELAFAIFGRRVDPQARLADDDRIEITRALVCDPKLARRKRAARKA